MRASERETAGLCHFAQSDEDHRTGFVREDRFSSLSLPKDQQFSFWRDQTADFADVSLADEAQASEGYLVDVLGYDLGKIAVSAISAEALKFRRSAHHIRHREHDHWILSYCKCGDLESRCGKGSLRAGPQSLSLTSLAYPFEGETSTGTWISLYIARDHLLPVAGQLDRLNHSVLHGITAHIAIEFLTSMTKLLPITPISELPIFVETAIIVMKGFADQAGSVELNPSRPILVVRLEMVKRFIQENLSSPNLEPDDICAAMKLSRRQLYYLFEEIGGVSAYIRSQRLMAAHEVIADPAEDRPIHIVAASFGFHDAALFSRQFKAQFGYSPKEAREAKRAGYAPLATPPRSISEWLGQVRHESL